MTSGVYIRSESQIRKMKTQQQKFTKAAKQCKGKSDYRECLSRKLRK